MDRGALVRAEILADEHERLDVTGPPRSVVVGCYSGTTCRSASMYPAATRSQMISESPYMP